MIYGLFNCAVGRTEYTAVNWRMIGEEVTGIGVERGLSGYYTGILWRHRGEIRKTGRVTGRCAQI